MSKKQHYGTIVMVIAVFLLYSFWFGLILTRPNHGNTSTAMQLALLQECAILKFFIGAGVGCCLGIVLARISRSNHSAPAQTQRRSVGVLVMVLLMFVLSSMIDLGYKYHLPWALSCLPFSIAFTLAG